MANVLKIAVFATGPVLGIYLLARFAPRVRQPAALSGFVLGVAAPCTQPFRTIIFRGNDGNDTLIGSDGSNFLSGGAGDDSINPSDATTRRRCGLT